MQLAGRWKKWFLGWGERRAEKRKKRRMAEILDKLIETGEMAFEEGLRLQIQEQLFDDEDTVKLFISRLAKTTKTHVRASSAGGLITFYDDGEVDNSQEVVVVMLMST